MSARIIGGLALTSATVYGTQYLNNLPAYHPTPSSLVQNVIPLLRASVSGLAGHRYDSPETFNSEHRALIGEGPDHVANVNASLNERGIGISDSECVLIDSQFRLGVMPGSPLDSALEYHISGSFYDSYQHDLKQGEVLSELADDYQITQIRLNASNNLLGSYLHSAFDRAKVTTVNVIDTINLDNDELVMYSLRHHEQRDKAISQISEALEHSSQHGDIKQRCISFREKMSFFRGVQEDTQLEQNNQTTPATTNHI